MGDYHWGLGLGARAPPVCENLKLHRFNNPTSSVVSLGEFGTLPKPRLTFPCSSDIYITALDASIFQPFALVRRDYLRWNPCRACQTALVVYIRFPMVRDHRNYFYSQGPRLRSPSSLQSEARVWTSWDWQKTSRIRDPSCVTGKPATK